MASLDAPAFVSPQKFDIRPCGDTGLLVDVGDNNLVHSVANAIGRNKPAGVVDVVPAMTTVLVVIDAAITSLASVAASVRTTEIESTGTSTGREVTIPVVYDGDDLDFVAEHSGLGVDGVIQAHTESPWRVAFCGFAPGYAYLIGGDPRLTEIPRRGESRVRVPAGSVAVAGGFSAVYPRQSPGGWQLIGSTDRTLWDTDREPPALLSPGYRVRFERVDSV